MYTHITVLRTEAIMKIKSHHSDIILDFFYFFLFISIRPWVPNHEALPVTQEPRTKNQQWASLPRSGNPPWSVPIRVFGTVQRLSKHVFSLFNICALYDYDLRSSVLWTENNHCIYYLVGTAVLTYQVRYSVCPYTGIQ